MPSAGAPPRPSPADVAMNLSLLPRHTNEFHSKSFWEKFFQTRHEAFEWYGSFAELREVVVTAQGLKADDSILVVGCGNSDFSVHLYEHGCTAVTNVDFEPGVIEEMGRRHAKCERMRWVVADMTALGDAVPSNSFDCIIDKGALDALASSETPEVHAQVTRYFGEVSRVLRPGGRYVCVSLAQDHILRWWQAKFARGSNWHAACHATQAHESPYVPFVFIAQKQVAEVPAVDTSSVDSVVVYFDERGAPAAPTTVAVDAADGSAAEAAPFFARVGTVQYFCRQRSELRTLDIDAPSRVIDLWAPDATRCDGPRFTMLIVDVARLGMTTHACAAVLIPQGREREYLFSSDDGLRQIGESAGCARLVGVRFNRGHEFGSIEEVKAELSPIVLELAPPGHYKSASDSRAAAAAPESVIPFLALGDDDPACPSRVVARGVLGSSGAYIVEEVDDTGDEVGASASGADGGGVRRRLIFLDNQNVIQTEVRLAQASALLTPAVGASGAGGRQKTKSGKRKGGGKKKGQQSKTTPAFEETSLDKDDTDSPIEPAADTLTLDHRFVCFAYHRAIIAGMSLIAPLLQRASTESSAGAAKAGAAPDTEPMPVPTALIIGLGGGALPMALHHFFSSSLQIVVCELEQTVVDVAKEWFGFRPDSVPKATFAALSVLVADGLEVVQMLAARCDAHPSGSAGRDNRVDPSKREEVPCPPRPLTSPLLPPTPRSEDTVAVASEHDGSPSELEASLSKFNPMAVIVIDVDSKDASVGMSCPPLEFVTREVSSRRDAMPSCFAAFPTSISR